MRAVAGEFGNPKRHSPSGSGGEGKGRNQMYRSLHRSFRRARPNQQFLYAYASGVVGPQFRLDDEQLHTAKAIFDICISVGEINSDAVEEVYLPLDVEAEMLC